MLTAVEQTDGTGNLRLLRRFLIDCNKLALSPSVHIKDRSTACTSGVPGSSEMGHRISKTLIVIKMNYTYTKSSPYEQSRTEADYNGYETNHQRLWLVCT